MLPEFALETYFARWEFTARYNLTASDAQAVSLARLLELGPADRAEWESLSLGYTWPASAAPTCPATRSTAASSPTRPGRCPRPPTCTSGRSRWAACPRPMACPVLARIALTARDTLLAAARDVIARNRPRFAEFFARHADLFTWSPPDARLDQVGLGRADGPESLAALEEFLARRG
ncbi:MAG: hypothetical protein ACRDRJ_25185 [Streptosporangiaceae bacterium]